MAKVEQSAKLFLVWQVLDSAPFSSTPGHIGQLAVRVQVNPVELLVTQTAKEVGCERKGGRKRIGYQHC